MIVPDGWEEKRLDQCGTIVSGSTPSTTVPAFWDGDIVWVTPFDLSRLQTPYLTDSAKRITAAGLRRSSVQLLPPESVVLSSRAPIGYVAIPSVPFCTNQGCKSIKLNEEIDSRFAYYNVLFSIDKIRALGEGTTFSEISKTALSGVLLSFPTNKTEQARIAAILSAADHAIQQTEALIAKQKRITAGLMHDLLTRGIDANGRLRSTDTHAFKGSPLGHIPEEWTVQTLGMALRNAGGFLQTGPFGSQLHAHEYVHEGVPVIMPQDIIGGHVSTAAIARIPDSRAQDLRKHRVIPNDIVFSRRGELSRAAAIGERETDWVCGTGCFLLRAPAAKIDARWLADVYRHHHVQRQVQTGAVGSTMPSLNNAVMESLTIAFPQVDEQTEIARRRKTSDAATIALEQHLQKLRSLKSGLMQDLLTGRRRVTSLLEAANQAVKQVS